MSGFEGANTAEGGDQFASILLTGDVGSALTRILMADAIVPGASPSYELCKLIYSFHPIGAKMAETPINMAQSQKREISIPVSGEERLVDAFDREWQALGADVLIKNVKTQSRIYGISSLVLGDRNKPDDVAGPVDWESLADATPYFKVLDPLNTAGSLVLNQDPNSPDYQTPTAVRSGTLIHHALWW